MWKYLASIVISAGIITGAVFLYKNRHQLFRPDFDRTGGTLLVFEVDCESADNGLDELIAALQRRFDGSSAGGIVVRAGGEGRIEIGVPGGKRHDEQVEMVKRLAPRAGVLQFRIVANRLDDEEAFNAALLPAKGAKLDAPPPPPRNARGGDEFPVKLPGEPEHRYRWARLSEGHVKSLLLSPTGLMHENPLEQPNVEASVRSGVAFSPNQMQQALVQARKLAGGGDPAFFLLVRDPVHVQEVPADALENVRTNRMRGQAVVLFRLRREGGERFDELAGKTIAADDGIGVRRLAILLDGEVLTTPHLEGLTRRDLSITGNFSLNDAEDIALLLRGGALPCRIGPTPVRETTTGKRK